MAYELKADEIKIGEDVIQVEEVVASYVKDLEASAAGKMNPQNVRQVILDVRNEIKNSFSHQCFLDDILGRLAIL